MRADYDLSQSKGALKGTMSRCEFTDKSLALSSMEADVTIEIDVKIIIDNH